ncbi:MAG: 4'-phosphopantetheinyl transferase superfamily protein [Deltaproteobacteria bacterium]|jgi:4'-phosphopantetheinyl transferase|nr:4'-phosphopantetheinyl transferase superfamily protein [Deltaproteobacteria bacterium]
MGLDVYLTPTPKEEEFAQILPFLPPLRQQKFHRYRLKEDKARTLAAGLLLRRFLNVTKDADLTYGPFGQPRLNNNNSLDPINPLTQIGPHFSLSHSGHFAALAIGSQPLGLDLELAKPERDWDRLSPKILSPLELTLMAKWPEPKQFALAVFVLKESLAKALGLGLSWDIFSLEVMGPKQLANSGQSSPELALAPETTLDSARQPHYSLRQEGRDWLLGHWLIDIGHSPEVHLALCATERGPINFWLATDLTESLSQEPLSPGDQKKDVADGAGKIGPNWGRPPTLTPLAIRKLWHLAL